jgi:hypothetical protein
MTGAFEEYSVIHKEKYFDIIYHKDFNWLGINNHSSEHLNVEILELEKNYSLQGLHSLKMFNFLSVPVNEVKELFIITSDSSSKEIFFYKCIIGDNIKVIDLNKINNYEENLNLVVFTGHGGGGTSIVVKLLRYLGVHFGDDCGSITNRKAHESVSFRHLSYLLNDEENQGEIFNSLSKIMSVYNIKYQGLNCFKDIKISQKLIHLSKFIESYKVVSILKEPNNYFNTPEGERFYNSSKIELMEYQRPLVEGVPMFHLDFYKFFTDYTYVNKVLNFIGHDKLIDTEEEFIDLKNKIDFNEKALER